MSALLLPEGMSARIAFEARAAGARNVETGGFILAPPDAPASVLALTGEKSITRRRDLFLVDGLAMATLFEWVVEHELTVAVQWHTHGGRAFLSETDLEHGFNVLGFTTTVVPYYPKKLAVDQGTTITPEVMRIIADAQVTYPEGFAVHPEWVGGPQSWRSTGNPFLYVVQTLQFDLNNRYQGRMG